MRRGLLIVLLAAGCSSGSEKPILPEPTTPINSARCREIDVQIQDAIAKAGGTCDTDADCSLIGGQTGGTQTCDCAPFILDCGGMPMPKNAPGLDRLNTVMQEFRAAGCATGAACDCGVRGPLTCSAEHRCIAEARGCLGGSDEGW